MNKDFDYSILDQAISEYGNEEKAFYDILMALRDQYNFEYGENKLIDGVVVNDKCK